ncbi:MAG: hypothetical protein M0C28_28895 [Candidatus Moduliflexus flocculans]|nr:hypothetical protein [Candidatus Moduliflexus flocculans]
MIKGSLATFINAITYPDKTCYPVASQNVQDFYNLIDVYMDAVFHPLISEQTLMQEGWHYELDDPLRTSHLQGRGLQRDERRVFIAAMGLLEACHRQHSLFPRHVYGIDSGGDPRHIPDLTHESVQGVPRQTYYHPSNSFIFFYGNDDLRQTSRARWKDISQAVQEDSRSGRRHPAAKKPFKTRRRRLQLRLRRRAGYRHQEETLSHRQLGAARNFRPGP